MNTRIVYSEKDKLHFIIRVLPTGQTLWGGSNEFHDYYHQLNGILASKNQDQFIQVVNELPSLFPCERFKGEKRVYSLPEAIREFPSRFSGCDAKRLEAEMFLESARPMRSNKTSLKSFMEKWGGDGASFVGDLQYANPDECAVLVEPVQDWMLIRNSLSVCARLLGQLERGSGVSLEEAGFSPYMSKRLSERVYALPFKYNAYFSFKLLDWERQDPLLYTITEGVSEKTNVPFYKVELQYLDEEDKSVFITTKPIVTNEYYSLIGKTQEKFAEDKTLYLCVKDSGNQEDMAKSIVGLFTTAFRKLEIPQDRSQKKANTCFCGWGYDATGEYANLDEPRMMPYSLASTFWFRLVYRPSRRVTLCKWCGNAVVSKEQGTRKEFCSGSCRVQYGKANPQR